MAVDVYINFNGNCREAVEFYTKVFGLEKPQIMSFGDMPPNPDFPISDEVKNLIMHTQMKINGTNVMFSDVPPGMPLVVGNNMSLVFVSKNLHEIETVFNELKVGGSIDMELQETFWSKCYGNLTDKFGTRWQFNLESESIM